MAIPPWLLRLPSRTGIAASSFFSVRLWQHRLDRPPRRATSVLADAGTSPLGQHAQGTSGGYVSDGRTPGLQRHAAAIELTARFNTRRSASPGEGIEPLIFLQAPPGSDEDTSKMVSSGSAARDSSRMPSVFATSGSDS